MVPPPLRRLAVPRPILTEMMAQAEAERPRECCGLLAGTVREDGTGLVQERYPLVNAAASPEVEYYSEGRSMVAACKDMRHRGLDVLAVYHSHPTSDPIPSKKDLARNFYGPGVVHFILSLTTQPPTVRGWWLDSDRYREAGWEVVD
jgi:proteasome lid subunit RPN8/RPN11